MLLKWVIILNYNVAEHCIRQLEALFPSPDCGIFIVDNASDPDDYRVLESACRERHAAIFDRGQAPGDGEMLDASVASGSSLVLVRNAENLGYSFGNNTGLRVLHRVIGDGGRFLIINPDLIISKEAMHRLLDSSSELAGPAIFDHWLQDINVQGHAMDFTTGFIDENLRRPGYAAMLHGCCLMMSGRALSRYGYLPDENFLYEEELKYFERVSRLGGHASYLPDIRVEHIGKASTKKLSYGYFYYIFRNKLCYFLEIAGPKYRRPARFSLLYIQWCAQTLWPQIRRGNWDGVRGLLHGVWHGLRRFQGPRDRVFRGGPV